MSAQRQTRAAYRIYYDAPAEIDFTATVSAIRELARVDGRQIWQLALDRTALYPESGGQPFDTGTLTAIARSGASLVVPVTDVQEDEAGEVWHTIAKPLQEGTAVQGAVDRARRRDHMQQHSGQHLLSAVLWRDLGLKTVSFHLGADICTIDLAGGPLPSEALAQVEAEVNAVIAQALPIGIRYATQGEAQAMLLDGRLRKLPARDGTIRLIEIPGVDLNACGGTHVKTTAAIGPVLLRGTERVRDAVRLHFLCGGRALLAARQDHQLLTGLAASLSTGVDQVQAAVVRLQEDTRAAAKERTLLLHSLAQAEAAMLAGSHGGSAALLVHTLDPQLPGRTGEYARLLASAVVRSGSVPRVLVTLAQGDSCAVVLAAAQGQANCGAVLQAALGQVQGRGGGSRELAQGSLPLHRLQDLVATLQA